ncbi:PP2C family protein-serine/threonine phosphatase [Nonomuraea sp. MCN248]|uniref:PP2C family protein-serine/threonine phosphatase n=1 Tax=Nonomuraea corallina TaxID=2989783 RepID=A0ABT4S6U4_9ACTN|nr:PP2C family protein-serine/threonine phosphatase [Nonomuraea corallina]MDA0632720.1 PP2C family protein-serine/threonine phosphatase [Nonomuraea corallina]
MKSDDDGMLGGLLEVNHLSVMEELPARIAEHARQAGFGQTVVYVTDLQQQHLVPLPGQGDAHGEPPKLIRIDGTVPGRAFRDVEIVRARRASGAAAGEGTRWWVPLLDGTERVGVLGVDVTPGTRAAEPLARRMASLASLVALLVVSKRPHSDSHARAVRVRPMSLSAEVLWNLLPPGTMANDRVVVSAALEPAYEVGGDAYDFAVDGDTLYVSIFDAMGHDTSAGLTATIAVGACRNSRRKGDDLPATSEAIDAAIADHFTGRFVTALLAALDLRTGRLTWVNRGHPPPLLIRNGRRVTALDSKPDPPMGIRLPIGTGLLSHRLEPGDRLLFYTDGVVDAPSPDGEAFGLERFIDFVVRREADGVSAPETLRRLIQNLLEYHRGLLQDDATVLTVEWCGQRHRSLTL